MNYFVLLEIAIRMKNKQNKLCKKISEETGVHYTALEIIVLLYSDSTVTTAKEVCEYLNLKPNLVSFHVDKLVSDGYLVRESIDGDKRKVRLITTEKCESIGERCNQIRKELFEKFTGSCTKEELETFYSCILKIRKNIETINV